MQGKFYAEIYLNFYRCAYLLLWHFFKLQFEFLVQKFKTRNYCQLYFCKILLQTQQVQYFNVYAYAPL